ncbi:MAG: Rv3235 family protein [Mycobacterium sp.]
MVPPNTSALISPVVDYEPPAFGGPPVLPAVTALRPRRRAPQPPPRPSPADEARIRAAAIFADAALRRVLEVIDRRRPLAQLRPLMTAGLVDSLPGAAGAHGGTGPARLRRVVAQLCTPEGTAAEVAASYQRGNRVHAIACRVEQITTATGPRWRVVALHLG